MAMKSWRKTCKKLWKMDQHEFLDRSRQEFCKRSDAVLAGFGIDFVKGEPQSQGAKPGSFFFGPGQVPDLLQFIRQRLPEQTENIVARADRICSHRFDLLGYENLNYGPSINWHLD